MHYEQLRKMKLILGDFNAKVGRGTTEEIVEKYGLDDRNDRGDMFVQFCLEEEHIIKNTSLAM